MKFKTILCNILLALLALILIANAGFLLWALTPSPAQPAAIAALKSDSAVQVSQLHGWTVFTPTAHTPTTGFIFYPGGHISFNAYADALRQIAAQGYLVVLVPVPLSLAITATNAAAAIPPAFPTIRHWAIGGHSLGGASAAIFAYNHPDTVQGVIFWASYPPESNSLASSNLLVTSIHGSKDGLATPAKIEAYRHLLPPGAMDVTILGGNHAQFGNYGPQNGDNPADISITEQHNQVVNASVDLLKQLSMLP